MMTTLLKNLGSFGLSLTLAILVWVAAIKEENPPQEILFDDLIPIEVGPPAPGLVTIDELPETVQVRVSGPQDRLNRLSLSKFRAFIDLSNFSQGLHEIPIKVTVSDGLVDIIEQEPSRVNINLQTEQTISLPLTVELFDSPSLGYVSRQPTVTPETVTVTGPASLINQIDQAIIELSIRNSKETIERTVEVVIQGETGEQLNNNLKINPSRVRVAVPLEQRFDYKDVSVSAIVEGRVSPGYWVSNIVIEPATVTISGNPRVLNSIPGYIETAPLNLNQATSDVVQIVPLNLPDGVTMISEDNKPGLNVARVTVNIEAIESGKTLQRPIRQQGVNPNYAWVASPERVDVIVSGPVPILQTLQPDQVEVLVNLFDLRPGVYKVKPQVFLPEGLDVTAILPNTIEVTINPITK